MIVLGEVNLDADRGGAGFQPLTPRTVLGAMAEEYLKVPHPSASRSGRSRGHTGRYRTSSAVPKQAPSIGCSLGPVPAFMAAILVARLGASTSSPALVGSPRCPSRHQGSRLRGADDASDPANLEDLPVQSSRKDAKYRWPWPGRWGGLSGDGGERLPPEGHYRARSRGFQGIMSPVL